MKITISAVVMLLLIATPCLAGVESNCLFSIEGTKWKAISLNGTLPEHYYGFYEGMVCELLGTKTSCCVNIHPA